jgi:hypothetical protein
LKVVPGNCVTTTAIALAQFITILLEIYRNLNKD